MGEIEPPADYALTGMQQKKLHSALLAAFPTPVALARMVRFGLDTNLPTVAQGSSLEDTVFLLIDWAVAQGRVADLLTAAVTENPRHPQLSTVVAELRATGTGSPPPPGPAIDLSAWNIGGQLEEALWRHEQRKEAVQAERERQQAAQEGQASLDTLRIIGTILAASVIGLAPASLTGYLVLLFPALMWCIALWVSHLLKRDLWRYARFRLLGDVIVFGLVVLFGLWLHAQILSGLDPFRSSHRAISAPWAIWSKTVQQIHSTGDHITWLSLSGSPQLTYSAKRT